VPASQEQKVDFLLKKIGYSASKTGIAEDSSLTGSTKKAPFAEAIPSPLIVPKSSVWSDSGFIPTTPPTSNTTYVGIYTAANAYRMTFDNTVGTVRRSFIARSTYGNQTASIDGDWIDTQFGTEYIVKVYRNNPGIGTEGIDHFSLQQAGNAGNDGWFFDYSSGVLNFNGDALPSGIGTDNVYILGYRYTGAKGIQPPAGIGTFRDLVVSNNFKVGGISTFSGLIDANGIIEGIAGQNKIPSLYANYTDLPNAGTYHGMFAHVHGTQKGYFAHAGGWYELVNKETTGTVGTGTERYNIGALDATSLKVTGITTLGSIGISTGRIIGPSVTYIDPATVGAAGTVVILGNLQVDGTQTTVNSSTMTVTDKNIEVAKGAANNAAADGAGITVDAGSNADKTWQWLDATDSWTSSEHIRIAAGKVFGFANDPNSFIDGDGNDSINFTTNGGERLSIDSEGKLIIGGGSSRAVGFEHRLQIEDIDANPKGVSIIQNSANAFGAHIDFAKTRGSTRGSNTIVQDDDHLGQILWRGGDGTDVSTLAAAIRGSVDGTPASNDVPGRIEFYTSSSGSFAERVRIKSTGQVAIGTTVEGQVSADELTLSGSGSVGMTIRSTNSTESNIFMSDATTGSGEYAGWIKFKHNTTPNRWEFGAVNSQIFNILADGKVGINSDAPPTTFDVNGTSQFQDDVTFIGASGNILFDKTQDRLEFDNNIAAAFGDSRNLRIFANSSNGQINNYTGDLFVQNDSSSTNEKIYIRAKGAEDSITATANGAVQLYFDDSEKFTTTNTGVNITGITTTTQLEVGTLGQSLVGITTILDEDDMASDSATALVTQQSIKKYIDDRNPSGPGGGNLAVSADSGSNQTINLNSEVLDIEGTANEIETATGTNKVVIGLPNDVSITNLTLGGSVSAGSTTGIDGYYLKSTGIGVTWAVLPSSRTGLTTTATAGQTTFNFSYNVGFVDVFVNGVKLPSSEFTASNGSTIVLDDAAFANDTLEFISLNTVPVSSSAGASNLTGLADVTISGTPVAGETLQHNGSVFVNDYTVTSTKTSTSQASIHSLAVATYRSVEYTVQITEGTKYHVTKILAIHDGTNATFNEYGTLTTHSSLATFALDVNSGNMRLLATPASSNSTVFKVKFNAIKV